MKKIAKIMFIQGLVLSLIQTAWTFSGSGTELYPYLITNVNELQEMKDGLNAWYKLANDIDASETMDWNGGMGFLPVGDSAHGFAGHLKGDGRIISNLYINRSLTDNVGLFGKTDGAYVEDVTLADPNIKGRNQTGALSGYSNNSTITNCRSIRATVLGNGYVGGLLGQKDGGTIVGCSSHQPTVTATNYYYCGGLVGYRTNGTIIDCRCTEGNISGIDYVGGLVGMMSGSISDNYVDASVNATGSTCGGLVGFSDGDITNCHSVGIVIGGGNVGGLVGYKDGGILSNCSSQAAVAATGDSCGGLVGYGHASVNITSCHSTGRVVGNNAVGGLAGRNVPYCYYGCYWPQISRSYATGNVEGYQRVGGLVGESSCTSVTYSYSTGSVNGNSIVGGFVGYNSYGSISRCFSTGDSNSSDVDCGGFVGINGASITDCFATGPASGGSNFVGGFAGEATTGATTANCYSVGSVNGTYNFGGFAGYNSGTCSDCFWDVDTSGVGISGCGTGKTTAEMMQQATFDPPWNFATIWGIQEIQTYPFLMELSPICGDPWHPYPNGDLNYDCHVDFSDFAIFASNWLECTAPECD